VVRDKVVRSLTPSVPGGGTVNFVSPWGQTYSDTIQRREEGGTPNILGDIRVALAMLIKEALGQDWLERRNKDLRERATSIWERNPRLEFMGGNQSPKLPIFSFRVRDGNGGYVHHQFFTKLLSDVAGVQARGGCACAGAYAHRLLGINQEQSAMIEESIKKGNELEKPGWVRLNLSAIMTDDKVDQVISAVDDLAFSAMNYQSYYCADAKNARFILICNNPNKEHDTTSANN
ncbi:MAG: aminotransferase class V-fold PLP-dependent enzyme, partial [SAR324 cluster bacterium]|nr:aminotransferase class V-fold PLP-dependent enzyme [SAR324 cluster bacterium]